MERPQVVIKAIGVGGGGCNTIDRAIKERAQGLEFIAVNTDQQALMSSQAPTKIPIGDNETKGLGSGGDPAVGQRAAEEARQELTAVLQDADIVFIAAGMGGGTGTGAAPIIAQIALDLGALTIGFITMPFTFEGNRRGRVAQAGAVALKSHVDTLITVPNDRLLGVADKKMPLALAFALADDVLRTGIQGISDTITMPGLINLDLSDLKSVMANAGSAFMSIGRAAGDDRGAAAVLKAINSPMLDVSLEGARTILLNITGRDYTLFEVQEVVTIIQKTAAPDADIVLGAVIDESMTNELQVTLIATSLQDAPEVPGTGSYTLPAQAAGPPGSARAGRPYERQN